MDRRRADPPAVLRGHRRRPGRLRLGLRPPAAPPARRRGDAARRPAAAPTRSRPTSTRSASSSSARCCGRSGHGDGPAAGAADRRDRPRRRRVRGLPARGAVGLPDHGARAGRVPRRDSADRRADDQPHARRARRAQAALPLPLGRAPELRPRGGDRAPARARRARDDARPPGRGRRRDAARPQPLQAARRRRDDRLGVGARAARRHPARRARRRRHARHRAEVPGGPPSASSSTASPTSSSRRSSAACGRADTDQREVRRRDPRTRARSRSRSPACCAAPG